MAERTITELEAKIAEQRAYIDLLVKAGKGSEAEADRLKAALTRLQMGPDALTQAGLKIVIDALYTGERAALATPQQEQVEDDGWPELWIQRGDPLAPETWAIWGSAENDAVPYEMDGCRRYVPATEPSSGGEGS